MASSSGTGRWCGGGSENSAQTLATAQCHTSRASVHSRSRRNTARGVMLAAGTSRTPSAHVALDQNFWLTMAGSEGEHGKEPPKNIGDCSSSGVHFIVYKCVIVLQLV